MDQYGRPIVGAVNLCPQALIGAGTGSTLFKLLLHELLHVLGFAAASFPYFRDCSQAAWPCTPRVANPSAHLLLFGSLPFIRKDPATGRSLVVTDKVNSGMPMSCQ